MSWSLTFKNLCFPVFCNQCGVRLFTEENLFFCPTCWELSPIIERPFCTFCGQPHQGRAGFGAISNFPCQECRAHPPEAYSRLYAAAHYESAIAEAIKLLKFYGKMTLVGSLAELMIEFAQREIEVDTYDCLVPVPLHKVRERDRGFNQSRILAEALLPAFPKATLHTALERIRPTLTQSSLNDPKRRLENVRGAFAMPLANDLEGRRVLLIDDVSTSGGTVRECATALARAGAGSVDVFVVAIPVKWANRPAGVL